MTPDEEVVVERYLDTEIERHLHRVRAESAELLVVAAQLLSIATVGRGADPVEFDRRVTDWLRHYDTLEDK